MTTEEKEELYGARVFYIDDERIIMPAIVTSIDDAHEHDPKIGLRCNLAVWLPRGVIHPRIAVSPAFHNGVRWIVLNKWIRHFSDVPNDEYDFPTLKTRINMPPPANPRFDSI